MQSENAQKRSERSSHWCLTTSSESTSYKTAISYVESLLPLSTCKQVYLVRVEVATVEIVLEMHKL
jgi:hypothetical protein